MGVAMYVQWIGVPKQNVKWNNSRGHGTISYRYSPKGLDTVILLDKQHTYVHVHYSNPLL